MTDPAIVTDDSPVLHLHRDLDAPRDLVWAALTDPAHLDRWWGPSGFRTETHVHELRPGGAWQLTMHGPDGRAYPNHVVFDAVDAPERLVLRYVPAPGGVAARHVTTITLDALSPRRTRITLAMRFSTAEERREVAERYGAVEGGRQTLGKLADLVATLQGHAEPVAALVVRRVVSAPVELVWSAWTTAAHLDRWFHPSSWTIFASTLDLRVGGAFHYGFSGPELPPTWGVWRFTEIDAPRRLGFVLSFATEDGQLAPSPFGGPWPARVATTVTLERHAGIGGGTVVTVRSTPLDATDAEASAFRGMIPSMQDGWGETLDSLAAFVPG